MLFFQKKKFCIIFIFFIFSIKINAQNSFLSLNRSFNLPLERKIIIENINFQTSFKPYLENEVEELINLDFIYQTNKSKNFFFKKDSYFLRKLRKENFIIFKDNDFKITFDPIFNFEIGRNINSKKNTFTNTRGFSVRGKILYNFSFFTSFYENQSIFNDYIHKKVDEIYLVNGQGRVKPYKENAYDYAYSCGIISYTYFPISNNFKFNFQFGHGKNFIGDGYRSLLLSDNSFKYLFLKITSKYKNFRYTNLFTSLMDLGEFSKHSTKIGGFDKKWANFHLLSFLFDNYLEVSIFEGTIFGGDFDVNYFNPLILSNILIKKYNTILGTNIKLKISKKSYLYNQFSFDNLELKKYAFQIGYKFFDLFNIKNLIFQSEYNQVQPYVYSSEEVLKNYTHYQEALAHPIGANFKESVSFLNYRFKNILLEFKFNYVVYGKDSTNTNFGKNIFLPYLYENFKGNKNSQGIKTFLIYKEFCISYLLNPKTNLNISFGISERKENNKFENQKSLFYYFAMRTSLNNFYYDF